VDGFILLVVDDPERVAGRMVVGLDGRTWSPGR
jgi:hypothetical protein